MMEHDNFFEKLNQEFLQHMKDFDSTLENTTRDCIYDDAFFEKVKEDSILAMKNFDDSDSIYKINLLRDKNYKRL